jgi:hypothetical protein
LIKFLKEYQNPNRDRINYKLINKEYDGDIVEYIVNCCKILEAHEGIKFIGYKYISDESQIDLSRYIINKSRKNTAKKDKKTRYRSIRDSRYGEIYLQFEITGKSRKRTSTDNDDLHNTPITEIIYKRILVPVPDKRGIYKINGTEYFLMYQLTEKSTYTTSDAIVLKSFMGISMKRNSITIKDINGTSYAIWVYYISMFKKETNVLTLIIAKKGFDEAMRFMLVDKILRFTDEPLNEDNIVCFSISKKLYISLDKYWFDKYSYVRSIVAMLIDTTTNRITLDTLKDPVNWIELMGSSAQSKDKKFARGLSTITTFDRLIDNTTKKSLKLHSYNRKDIYTILRWMMAEFNNLRKKNNIDLENKRLRCNEYLASLLMQKLNEKLNNLMNLGGKATIENIRDVFKFPGDIIFLQLQKSGLLRCEGRVNDMDFFNKLKITLKGPNAYGKKTESTIPIELKGIDPSFIGRLDINVCGKSDPGMSAVLTPFCETDGLYFSGENEPEDTLYDIGHDMYTYEDGKLKIPIYVPDKNDFYSQCEYLDNLYDSEIDENALLDNITVASENDIDETDGNEEGDET